MRLRRAAKRLWAACRLLQRCAQQLAAADWAWTAGLHLAARQTPPVQNGTGTPTGSQGCSPAPAASSASAACRAPFCAASTSGVMSCTLRALASAPASSSCCTAPAWLFAAAACSGLRGPEQAAREPLRLHKCATFSSTLLPRGNGTACRQLPQMDRMGWLSGTVPTQTRYPLLYTAHLVASTVPRRLGSAPPSSRAAITPRRPLAMAKCRGICPVGPPASLGSAPAASSCRTCVASPA